MYRTCAFAGCDIAVRTMRDTPHRPNGTTSAPPTSPTSSHSARRHHHVVHDGWQLHLAPDRTLTITQPDGNVYATAPTHIRVAGTDAEPDDPVEGRRRQPEHQTKNRNLVS